MSIQRITYPAHSGLNGMQQTSTSWLKHANTLISAASGVAGVCTSIMGDGSGIKTIEVLVHSTSQAGTLTCSIQQPSATPDVNNVSGLPNGTTIANGTASAAVTGGVTEIVTLTFATAPTPSGFYWLVFEGSSGGVIDIQMMYQADWDLSTSSSRRMFYSFRHDGLDWNNGISSTSNLAIVLKDASGNVPDYHRACRVPMLNTGTAMTTPSYARQKQCVGVKFTAQANLTKLAGILWSNRSFDADMNFRMRLFTAAGVEVLSSAIVNQQALQTGSASYYFPFSGIATLIAGTAYRAFLCNPDDTIDDVSIHTWALSATAEQASRFGVDDGEFAYTFATDPPEYGAGGVGTWSDDPLKFPWMQFVFEQDLTAISGGGVTATRASLVSF